MDKPPAVIPAKAGIQEPPAVTIESVAGAAHAYRGFAGLIGRHRAGSVFSAQHAAGAA